MEPKDLIKALIDQYLAELHVALPARIEKYDPKTLRAEVTVLAKKTLEGKPVTIPPIVEVPVMILKSGPFVIRPPYVQGDIVQVLFNERALDNIFITGDPQEVGLNRMHSLDDAVVIGGMRVDNQDELPEEYSDGLYIANVDKDSKIALTKDGDIFIHGKDNVYIEGKTVTVQKADTIKVGDGDTKDVFIEAKNVTIKKADAIKLGENATEGVLFGNKFKEWADKHTHPFSWTDGGGSGNTSPSPNPSPDPSTKVKVE